MFADVSGSGVHGDDWNGTFLNSGGCGWCSERLGIVLVGIVKEVHLSALPFPREGRWRDLYFSGFLFDCFEKFEINRRRLSCERLLEGNLCSRRLGKGSAF